MSKKIIKLPRNKTAAMQLMQQLATSGHYHYVSGSISKEKLVRYLKKLSDFGIYRDAPGRSYDRKRGIASVHLVVYPLDSYNVFWCLMSTNGKTGLNDPAAPTLGPVRDTRLRGQHLGFLDGYELLYQEKRIAKVAGSTWTWRLTAQRYAELEAAVVQIARERRTGSLAELVERQSSMPLFSGVRGQVLKLNALAAKLSEKFKHGPLQLPELPYLIKLPLYASPPMSLDAWLSEQFTITENC